MQDLLEQLEEVPVQPVGKAYRNIGEPVDRLERRTLSADPADYDPSALGAQVHGSERAFRHSGSPDGSHSDPGSLNSRPLIAREIRRQDERQTIEARYHMRAAQLELLRLE
jgi:hypothetical protein